MSLARQLAEHVNGTAAHVLDFDHAKNTMFGHASAVMIPALIAAGGRTVRPELPENAAQAYYKRLGVYPFRSLYGTARR